VKRNKSLPGIGVFYGDAGLGKSKSCSAARVAFGAVYVETRSFDTKKSFLLTILSEMGIKPEATIPLMVSQICEQLMLSQAPLIIDEGDRLVSRNLLELVRDIYEGSGAAGACSWARSASRWRSSAPPSAFYDRVLKWQPAERADWTTRRSSRKLYAPDVELKDDLVDAVLKASRGIARKVSTNFANINEEAKKAGKRTMGLAEWGERGFYTGDAPVRRSACELTSCADHAGDALNEAGARSRCSKHDRRRRHVPAGHFHDQVRRFEGAANEQRERDEGRAAARRPARGPPP
jgi:hypothetical protein